MARRPTPKEAGEQADEMIRKLSQQGDGQAQQTPPAPADEQTPADPSEAIPQDDGAAQPTPPVTADTTPQPDSSGESEKSAELEKQLEQSEHRWRVLQGMIAKKDQQLDQMREVLAKVTAAQPASPSQDQLPAQPQSLITADEVGEYGDKYIDMVRRAGREGARTEVASAMGTFDERLKAIEQRLDGVQTSTTNTAQSAFLTELGHLVPTYQQLNNDPKFAQWLEAIEPAVGASRKDLLASAVQNFDAQRTAWFFNAYIQEMSPPVAPAVPEPSAQPTREDLVAPGRGQPATPPQNDGKRKWTRESITQLYDDYRNRRISADEYAKLEKDLFKAQIEGRIAA